MSKLEQAVVKDKPASEKHVILTIKERMVKQLDTKTSWGKNEVKNLFDDIVTEELTKQLFMNNKSLLEGD